MTLFVGEPQICQVCKLFKNCFISKKTNFFFFNNNVYNYTVMDPFRVGLLASYPLQKVC